MAKVALASLANTLLHMRPGVNMSRLRSSSCGALAVCLSIVVLTGCSAASRGARALERADRYFKAGDYDKAKIEYSNALRLTRANLHRRFPDAPEFLCRAPGCPKGARSKRKGLLRPPRGERPALRLPRA